LHPIENAEDVLGATQKAKSVSVNPAIKELDDKVSPVQKCSINECDEVIGGKNGAQRASKYGANWPTASLDDAVSRFAGSNPVISTTAKGKKFFTNPDTGIQVVQDVKGNYFRVFDPSIKGKRAYFDMNGNIPNNIVLESGKQAGRTQGEYNQVTHFKIME